MGVGDIVHNKKTMIHFFAILQCTFNRLIEGRQAPGARYVSVPGFQCM